MGAWHYWIIFGIILLILEIFTPGFLLASFGIGAFGSSIIAYFDFELKYQLMIFSIITMVVFLSIRDVYKKYFSRFDDQRKIGIEALVGKNCKVIETINNSENIGRVKIGGEIWKAFSELGGIIDFNERVIVTKIEGATAYVIKNK